MTDNHQDPFMQLSESKLRRMVEHQVNLSREREQRLQLRKALALQEIQRLVAQFRAVDPDIKRIILFGSLARDDARSPDFDIDLAVECTGSCYLALVAAALGSDFRVDVVDLNSADDRIKTSVARDGVVLYEG